MTKAILETSIDTSLYTNLNISINEIVQASVDTIGVFVGDQHRVKRICTKTDNNLKVVMDAHLEKQASHYS